MFKKLKIIGTVFIAGVVISSCGTDKTTANDEIETISTEETTMQETSEIETVLETSVTESVSETESETENFITQRTETETVKNNFDTYDNQDQHDTSDTYVLNTSSMKIHHPDCRSVAKIAPENYSTSSLGVTELLSQGYSTCGICFK